MQVLQLNNFDNKTQKNIDNSSNISLHVNKRGQYFNFRN